MEGEIWLLQYVNQLGELIIYLILISKRASFMKSVHTLDILSTSVFLTLILEFIVSIITTPTL